MIQTETINGILLAKMIRKGAINLRSHVEEVNDLNVFPIPDGDTGDNMLMTCMGGVDRIDLDSSSISEVARSISDGMLLGARGNSGVILSQIFDGMAKGLGNEEKANCTLFKKVLRDGTESAYNAVMEPTEGTILTVMREATEYVSERDYTYPKNLLCDFIDQAKRTLEKTPDMLPVLKKAGVVDSGGAGLIHIVEGMVSVFSHEDDEEEELPVMRSASPEELDYDLFTADSVLEFGYCTEVLLRLQNAKTDIDSFSIDTIRDYLKKIGDSVVTFKNGSVVKVHVHTKTPDRVLAFCQQYGEFLKIKIENMSLQHNNLISEKEEVEEKAPKKRYAVVAVACGEGIKNLFTERGADYIVDGGQSMNPSTQDFLDAFKSVNAESIFVFPNNGNVVLAARMAAGMYSDSKVYVIESHNIGEGYAALSMYNPESDSAEEIASDLNDAMSGVTTLHVSRSIRDAEGVKSGDYIGFTGKDILFDDRDRMDTVVGSLGKIDPSSYDICLLIWGNDADGEEAEEIAAAITKRFPGKEVYTVEGKQDIYDYILILE